MRAELQHPKKAGLVAAYGLNGALHWWIECRHEGRLLVEYDALTCGKPTTPAGILSVLVEHGFFEQQDIFEARDWLVEVEGLEEIEDEGARRAAQVIVALKTAGAE